MGGKQCECHDTAQIVMNPTKFNHLALIRGVVCISLLVSLCNSIVPSFITRITGTDIISKLIPSFSYVLAVLIAVVTSRGLFVGTCCLPSLQLDGKKLQEVINGADIAADERIFARRMEMAQRLATALTFQTISYDPHDTDNKTDYNEFLRLHQHIQTSYPLVHQHLERVVVNKYSLVYVWAGSDPSLKPCLLTAHQDVVPTPEVDKWKHDPFGGVIEDGCVWGRGAIDDKQGVLGWLEATEDLLRSGFKPVRTIYFGFGHDEEISGYQGAKFISAYLLERLGRDCFEFMMDEGLFILDGSVPGHKKPVAFVCVAEKGAVTVRLSVEVSPGHASTPPSETAIGIIAKAAKRLEDSPMPSHFDGPAFNLFGSLRSGFSGVFRFIMTNLWLFDPLLKRILASKQLTATMVRTTTALTVFKAGTKENVLPATASALVNHRIHPNDSIEKVLEWDRRVIADPRVKVEAIDGIEPAPVSDQNHPAFEVITHAIHRTFKGSCAVAPGLFVANSDSKHYWNLSPQIFRFNPITLHSSEINMFHGFNERIRIDDYARLVTFCRNVIVLNDARMVAPSTHESKKSQ